MTNLFKRRGKRDVNKKCFLYSNSSRVLFSSNRCEGRMTDTSLEIILLLILSLRLIKN